MIWLTVKFTPPRVTESSFQYHFTQGHSLNNQALSEPEPQEVQKQFAIFLTSLPQKITFRLEKIVRNVTCQQGSTPQQTRSRFLCLDNDCKVVATGGLPSCHVIAACAPAVKMCLLAVAVPWQSSP
jgi:hypothetical protein